MHNAYEWARTRNPDVDFELDAVKVVHDICDPCGPMRVGPPVHCFDVDTPHSATCAAHAHHCSMCQTTLNRMRKGLAWLACVNRTYVVSCTPHLSSSVAFVIAWHGV